MILPLTVKVPPAEAFPVAVKLGALAEPEAVPLAVVPSIAEPVGAVVDVAVLDAVHVTEPLLSPFRLAPAGVFGGDDHVMA